MTAEEIYRCDLPGPVGHYYTRLNALGPLGEVACALLRAQKNCDRIPRYDDEKYLAWIRGRREWAVETLAHLVKEHMDKLPVSMSITSKRITIVLNFVEFEFTNDRVKGWEADPSNQDRVFKLCDKLTSQ